MNDKKPDVYNRLFQLTIYSAFKASLNPVWTSELGGPDCTAGVN